MSSDVVAIRELALETLQQQAPDLSGVAAADVIEGLRHQGVEPLGGDAGLLGRQQLAQQRATGLFSGKEAT